MAVSILGDVTVDLADAMTLPTVVVVKAFALDRDVDVLVGDRTHVELSGRPRNDHLSNDTLLVAEGDRDHIVRIQAHTGLGDVTDRVVSRTGNSAV